MSLQAYPVWYRLDGQLGFLLWFREEEDHILVDTDQRLLSFPNPEELKMAMRSRDLKLSDDRPIIQDLDWSSKWLENPVAEGVDCAPGLATWNLFIDVWRSVKEHRDAFQEAAEPNRAVYEKLLFGSNIDGITPEDEDYNPTWSEDELGVLQSVFRAGLEMFRKNLRIVEPGTFLGDAPGD